MISIVSNGPPSRGPRYPQRDQLVSAYRCMVSAVAGPHRPKLSRKPALGHAAGLNRGRSSPPTCRARPCACMPLAISMPNCVEAIAISWYMVISSRFLSSAAVRASRSCTSCCFRTSTSWSSRTGANGFEAVRTGTRSDGCEPVSCARDASIRRSSAIRHQANYG